MYQKSIRLCSETFLIDARNIFIYKNVSHAFIKILLKELFGSF